MKLYNLHDNLLKNFVARETRLGIKRLLTLCVQCSTSVSMGPMCRMHSVHEKRTAVLESACWELFSSLCYPDSSVDKASDFRSKGQEFEPHNYPGNFSEQRIYGTLLLSTQVYKWVQCHIYICQCAAAAWCAICKQCILWLWHSDQGLKLYQLNAHKTESRL